MITTFGRFGSVNMSNKSFVTSLLTIIPGVIGFLKLIIWNRYVHTHYDGIIPKSTNGLIVGLTFLTWSFSFVVVIIRKEFPSPITLGVYRQLFLAPFFC